MFFFFFFLAKCLRRVNIIFPYKQRRNSLWQGKALTVRNVMKQLCGVIAEMNAMNGELQLAP